MTLRPPHQPPHAPLCVQAPFRHRRSLRPLAASRPFLLLLRSSRLLLLLLLQPLLLLPLLLPQLLLLQLQLLLLRVSQWLFPARTLQWGWLRQAQ